MNQKIPITLIDIPIVPIQSELDSENSTIFNLETIKEIQKIKKGDTCSVKNILEYVVPDLILNEILDINNPIIHLRISGDGRNVGRKIKHVMVTITILNDS